RAACALLSGIRPASSSVAFEVDVGGTTFMHSALKGGSRDLDPPYERQLTVSCPTRRSVISPGLAKNQSRPAPPFSVSGAASSWRGVPGFGLLLPFRPPPFLRLLTRVE